MDKTTKDLGKENTPIAQDGWPSSVKLKLHSRQAIAGFTTFRQEQAQERHTLSTLKYTAE